MCRSSAFASASPLSVLHAPPHVQRRRPSYPGRARRNLRPQLVLPVLGAGSTLPKVRTASLECLTCELHLGQNHSGAQRRLNEQGRPLDDIYIFLDTCQVQPFSHLRTQPPCKQVLCGTHVSWKLIKCMVRSCSRAIAYAQPVLAASWTAHSFPFFLPPHSNEVRYQTHAHMHMCVYSHMHKHAHSSSTQLQLTYSPNKWPFLHFPPAQSLVTSQLQVPSCHGHYCVPLTVIVVRSPLSLNRAAVWMPFIVHGSLTCRLTESREFTAQEGLRPQNVKQRRHGPLLPGKMKEDQSKEGREGGPVVHAGVGEQVCRHASKCFVLRLARASWLGNASRWRALLEVGSGGAADPSAELGPQKHWQRPYLTWILLAATSTQQPGLTCQDNTGWARTRWGTTGLGRTGG